MGILPAEKTWCNIIARGPEARVTSNAGLDFFTAFGGSANDFMVKHLVSECQRRREMRTKPVYYLAEKALGDSPEFRDFRPQYPNLQWIDDYRTFRRENLLREKECVLFALKRGVWLKPFHCYENKAYTYLSLDVAEGCLFDCVYCYLQTYLNHGALVLFVNLRNLEAELRQRNERNLWISTGLLSDSLLAESYFPVLPRISKWIPEGSVMELRSKSSDLTSLVDPDIRREGIVVSWSLNPKRVASLYEYGAASLEERLQAARQALDLGYRIAFHFDPVFYFEGWQELYSDLFLQISQFPKERTAFLSLGLFRFMPDLGAVIRKRFPFHEILTQEFFPDADGKYHYFRGIRKEMYRAFSNWLKPWKETVPVFWSMEPDSRLLPGL